jgi:hypothetical protein
MSIDRLTRVLARGAMAMAFVALASTGCRSTRNEVPPGPKYGMAGEPSSSVGFNSAPHPYNGVASPYGNASGPGQPGTGGAPGLGAGASSPPDGMPGLGAGGSSSFGTPAPSGNLSQPTNNLYGGPGTAGMAAPGR